MKAQNVNRYSAEELAEFKVNIEKLSEEAKNKLRNYQIQIREIGEAMDEEGDPLDSSSNNSDLEYLANMANFQKNLLRELENALVRIDRGNYGVCVVSGRLIDKKRLAVMPTALRSVASQNLEDNLGSLTGNRAPMESKPKAAAKEEKKEPVIFERIIRKKPAPAAYKEEDDFDFEEEEDTYENDDMNVFDSYVENREEDM